MNAQSNSKTPRGAIIPVALLALFKISTENTTTHPVKIENETVHIGVA